MGLSFIVTKGIQMSKSNVIIYKREKGRWAASVYHSGVPLFSSLTHDDIDDCSREVVELAEDILDRPFNPSEWVVYGKRLSDTAERQFASVSHGHHAQSR